MTSSQGVTNYYFRSREPETADVEQVFPVSKLSVSRRHYYRRDRRKRHQGAGTGRCLPGFDVSHEWRRWWSTSGQWSVRVHQWSVNVQYVLVVLLAYVTSQCPASADNSQAAPSDSSVTYLGRCRALVNHNQTLIELSRLHPHDISVRSAALPLSQPNHMYYVG